MDIYQQNILDYYKRPRQRGPLSQATYQSGVANPSCGDSVELFLVVKDNRVVEARWVGEGCVLSQAAADMLAEYVKGKTMAEVRAVNKDRVLAMVGVNLGPNRLKCALLPLSALHKAVV